MSVSRPAGRTFPMAFPRIFSLPHWAIGLVYLAGYVLLDWVSFIQPFATFGITPWNPPTGLSFVLVLLFGQRFVPLLFVAPLLADVIVRRLALPWPIELISVLIVGGGYSIGLMYLTRVGTRFNASLTSMRDLLVLLAVAGVSALFVATAYVGLLVVVGLVQEANFVSAAIRFWVGDMIGIAVVSPFALICLTRGLRLSVETAAQIAAILVALVVVFYFADAHHFQLFYVLFLPTVWMAVRGGLDSVTTGILATQIGLIVGVHELPQSNIDVTQFQALMLVLTMTGLVAGALVTEHRRTEMQLRLHQDSLARLGRLGSAGELAAAVAHEINQPLMAAGTYTRLVAETLGSGAMDHARIVETAGKAAAQVERAAAVLRRLRALIRLDQSGRAPAAIERIVRETLEMSRPHLDRHNVGVVTRIDPSLPQVMVDALQVEQVLLNLVRNSAEAISEAGQAGGTVTIHATRAADDSVAFEIIDTGPGFPPGFGSGDVPPLSSTKSEGLGVGLSLCRSIVQAHGGRLEVAGGPSGAVVRFTLPAVQPAKV